MIRVIEVEPGGGEMDATDSEFELVWRIAIEREYGLADSEIESGVRHDYGRLLRMCRIVGDAVFMQYAE